MSITRETLAGRHLRVQCVDRHSKLWEHALCLLSRYLCDFAYYCSLYHGQGNAALIHLPTSGGLSSADRLVPLLQTLIQTMLDRLDDPSGNGMKRWRQRIPQASSRAEADPLTETFRAAQTKTPHHRVMWIRKLWLKAVIILIHLFIQNFRKKKKENTRNSQIHIWRWHVKKYPISAIGVKNFEASDTEFEIRQSLVNVLDYFFPQSGNEHTDFVKV